MRKHLLTSGLDPEQQGELGELHLLEAVLEAYETSEPDSEQLLTQLQPFLVQPKGGAYWLRLARSQLSLVDGAFWWVSGLLLLLGSLLVFASGGVVAGIYALLSPVLAVAATAYLFRPETHSLREFELLSAVRPVELLYARLLLILGYNAGVALTLILLAWSQDVQLVLWRLLLIWFGPMVGFTGVALYTSLRLNALAGVILPLGLWGALIILGWREVVIQSTLTLPEVTMAVVGQSDVLLTASVVILLLGVMLIWQAGREAAR